MNLNWFPKLVSTKSLNVPTLAFKHIFVVSEDCSSIRKGRRLSQVGIHVASLFLCLKTIDEWPEKDLPERSWLARKPVAGVAKSKESSFGVLRSDPFRVVKWNEISGNSRNLILIKTNAEGIMEKEICGTASPTRNFAKNAFLGERKM